MSIGLGFLTLALLIFALSGLNPKVTNTPRVNLCVCLLLSHLLFLLVQEFIHLIRPHEVLNTVSTGLIVVSRTADGQQSSVKLTLSSEAGGDGRNNKESNEMNFFSPLSPPSSPSLYVSSCDAQKVPPK